MGAENKLLLPFGDATIFETTLGHIQSAHSIILDKIVVVLGHEADLICPCLEKYKPLRGTVNRMMTIKNMGYESGMTTSIQAGLHILNTYYNSTKSERNTEGGYMICLSDMPLISAEEYTYLAHQFADFYKKDKRAIVQPTYQGQRGNPTIFSKKYKDNILHLDYMEGCKPIVQANQNHVYLVEMPTPSVLRDADTPEAYAQLLALA